MDPATEENTNGKRVKFAQAESPSGLKQGTAVSCAKLTASICIASLPDAIKPLAQHYFSKFLASKIELLGLVNTKTRLANADYVPTSARFKFELKASTRVKEQAAAELTTLTDDTTYILEIFKNDLKLRVVKLVKLETKVLTEMMQFDTCIAIGALGTAIALHHFGVDNDKARTLIISTLEQDSDLLKHYRVNDVDSIETVLQKFFGDIKSATADPLDIHVVGTLSQEQKDSVESAVPSLTALIEALFARSWDNYLARKAELLRHVAVRSYVEENMREDATADVAMDLEDITVNSKKLGDLVAAQVNSSTRKLQQEISRLQKAVPKKQSGAQKSSAANKSKKKTDQKTTPRGGTNAQKAAAAARDSNAARQKTAAGKSKKEKKKANSNRKPRARS